MDLNDEQKSLIATRLAEGAGIADIQRLVNNDFGIHMTYMEVRFLIDDLDLELAKPKAPEPKEGDDEHAASSAEPIDAEAELLGQGVQVEIDKVKRPGAALSGTVVFSDGVKSAWFVDPYGRLGLDPDQEGYQPSEEDIQAFQTELQNQMQGPAGPGGL
ncbi:hypothetical protein [Pelagicoccus sp. SDUM812003]|uniref:hypothetical protein n=1 Tax=Pelagicoccus sp. SDUM812003 TaxID=3041267 RepID=UPI0028106D63|nr:hypothetical protein [Pelagicoccus sp. SDUM812003]MDQ8203885.1 hypothetical protein [Pelagicoccus sp. SDUM812003]